MNIKKTSILICLLLISLVLALAVTTAQNETGDLAADVDSGEEAASTAGTVEQKAYNWLINQSRNGNYNNDVFATSLAMLVLNSISYKWGVEEISSWLTSHQNPQSNCWPKTSCKPKETAFAYLALKMAGKSENLTVIEDWLKNAQKEGLSAGKWILQVSPAMGSINGTCKVSYFDSKGNEKQKSVTVKDGRFPQCGNVTFLDMAHSCLSVTLTPSTELTVDCDAVVGSFYITIIYQSSTNVYKIIKSENTKLMRLTLNNGCYGQKFKGACDAETSFYVNYALKESESAVNTKMYLEEVYDVNKPLHNLVLYKLTKDVKYLEALKVRQKSDGSWNSKEYDTALAILALKDDAAYQQQVTNANAWITKKQKSDGSWNSDVKDTSFILYALFAGATIELPSCTDSKKNQNERGIDCGGICQEYNDCCSNNQKDEGEEGVDCGGTTCAPCTAVDLCDKDGKCEPEIGETTVNCQDDCQGYEDTCNNGVADTLEEGVDCGGPCPQSCTSACDNDGTCDVDAGEDYNTCADDCEGHCGDKVCDSTESPESCPDECATSDNGQTGVEAECTKNEDCEDGYTCVDGSCEAEEGGFPTTILIIALAVILLLAGGFFGFKKFAGKGKKPSGPSKPDYKPFSSQMQKPSSAPQQPQGPSLFGRPTQNKVEDELERSMREARKILGKK